MIIVRIVVVLAALFGLAVGVLGGFLARAILAFPEEWMGGVDPSLPAVWLAIGVLGCGSVGVASLLAVPGAVIGPEGRRLPLLLLILPGFAGLLMSVGVLVLLVTMQPEWVRYAWYAVIVGAPSAVFAAGGVIFRRGARR